VNHRIQCVSVTLKTATFGTIAIIPMAKLLEETLVNRHDIAGDAVWGVIDPWAVEIRRRIHRFPELGLDTPQTQALVESILDDLGIERQQVIAHGVKGFIGPKAGSAILLRADMDGLPIQETTNLSFQSEIAGRMHACGHDAHTAMLLGAARFLKHYEKLLERPVVLMFQPGEEGPGGALPMIESGILTDPPVSHAVMVHVDSDQPVGVIGLKSGPAMASPNEFQIIIRGQGGHGAHPDKGVDAIVAAAAVIQASQTLVSREQDPVIPLVVTFGTIIGGYRENVLADHVTMTGTIRILQSDRRQSVLDRFTQLVADIAHAYRAEAFIDIRPGYPPLVTDVAFTNHVGSVLEQVLGSQKVVWLANPSMGGEDFAYLAERVAATNLHVGVAGPGAQSGLHSAGFVLNEDAIGTGSRALAAVAIFTGAP
jgi:amidohydrolase